MMSACSEDCQGLLYWRAVLLYSCTILGTALILILILMLIRILILTLLSGAGKCSLLFALTSAMLCNVQANTYVAGLNREASVIISALAIPTADLQTAIVQCWWPGRVPLGGSTDSGSAEVRTEHPNTKTR
jgi:hypothetical protein